jgi:hypothetical protein
LPVKNKDKERSRVEIDNNKEHPDKPSNYFFKSCTFRNVFLLDFDVFRISARKILFNGGIHTSKVFMSNLVFISFVAIDGFVALEQLFNL